MPVFTASGRISVKMQSSCSARNCGVTSIISATFVVFCAVSAVIALIAYTPFAIIVLMSAWIPAPPPESLPAIVSAVFIFICIPLSVSGEFAFIFYSQILSAFSRRSSAAFLISSQANRPLTTATPAIFLPFSKRMLPPSMPPIATTGIFTLSQISCKSA